MPFTLTCHVCGQKLTLFDLDVKKRKGTIRCNHCGAKINYDLDQRKIQQSGFWAEREPAFDPRAKNRLMQQIEREEKRRGKAVEAESTSAKAPQHTFAESPFAAKAGFAKFDLKTGEIVGAGATVKTAPAAPPKSRGGEKEISFKAVDKSHQKRTIRAVESRVTSAHASEPKSEKTFTAPPRVVTRTAHRNMTLVRQVQKAQAVKQPVKLSRVQSFWQKVKSFFAFGKK